MIAGPSGSSPVGGSTLGLCVSKFSSCLVATSPRLRRAWPSRSTRPGGSGGIRDVRGRGRRPSGGRRGRCRRRSGRCWRGTFGCQSFIRLSIIMSRLNIVSRASLLDRPCETFPVILVQSPRIPRISPLFVLPYFWIGLYVSLKIIPFRSSWKAWSSVYFL